MRATFLTLVLVGLACAYKNDICTSSSSSLGNTVCTYAPGIPLGSGGTYEFVAPGAAGTTTDVYLVASGGFGSFPQFINFGDDGANPYGGNGGNAVIKYTMQANDVYNLVVDPSPVRQTGASPPNDNGGSATAPQSGQPGGYGGGGAGVAKIVRVSDGKIALVAGGGGGPGSVYGAFGGAGGVFDATNDGAGFPGFNSNNLTETNGASSTASGTGCVNNDFNGQGGSTVGGGGGGSAGGRTALVGGGGGGSGLFSGGGGCGSSTLTGLVSGGGGGSSGTELDPSEYTRPISYTGDLGGGGTSAIVIYYNAQAASAAVQRKRTRRIRSLTCPKDTETACTTRSGGFECIDVQRELTSCGGCVMEGVPVRGYGQDCAAIPNAVGVACTSGKCVVRTCEFPYRVSDDRTECVTGRQGSLRRR